MIIRTSKNLTIAGIAGIVVVVASALVALFDGDANTNVNWETSLTAIWLGISNIMSKGQKSTGGLTD